MIRLALDDRHWNMPAAACPVGALMVSPESERFHFMRVVLSLIGIPRIAHAASGNRIIEMVEEAAPDVILVDDAPPIADALIIATRLRGHLPTARIPMIVFANPGRNTARLDVLRVLCDDLLYPLCSAQELHDAVVRCVPHLAPVSRP